MNSSDRSGARTQGRAIVLTVEHLGALELAARNSGNMRERHLAQILRFVRDHGPSSRAQIAAEAGLGISTMSELIGELRGRGLVSESEPVRTQAAGRPLREVRLDADRWLVGGLHIEAGGIRAKLATLSGSDIGRADRRLDDSVDLWEAIRSVLSQLLDARPPDTELVAVEIGMPGAIERLDGQVMLSYALQLSDVPVGGKVRAILAELTGGPPIAVGIDNDCNFAALAVTASAVAGPPNPSDRRQITVYLGGIRDIGGAVLINDEVLRGSHGALGDFDHWTAEPDGLDCWCGRRGCLAPRAQLCALLVGGGLAERAAAQAMVDRDPCAASAALLDAADAGDQQALEVLDAAGAALGSVIDALHAIVNPDRVLIGGFLGTMGRHLEGGIRRRFAVGASTVPKELLEIRILEEDPDAVVDGALVSAQRLCLSHPLHFTHGVRPI